MQGVVDQPAGPQNLVLGQGPDGSRGGGGGAGDGGAHHPLPEPVSAARDHAFADGGQLLARHCAVGQQAASLGLPEQGDPVDGFATAVQRAQAPVELPVGRVGEVSRPQPGHHLAHSPRLFGEDGQEEPLVLGDPAALRRRRDVRGGRGPSGGWDRTRIGSPASRKVGEYAGQDVRREQRSLDLALDGVGPSCLAETDRMLGDGAVNRPLQHHASVHRSVLGSGTRLDQSVGVRRGQPAHVLSGLLDRVGHP